MPKNAARGPQKAEIPLYFIYGVAPRAVDLGFVHVETVSARAAIHNGDVKAHRHPTLHQLTLWTKGEGEYFIEDRAMPFQAPMLAIVPAGMVHGFKVTPSSDALVISISEDFAAAIESGHPERKLFAAPQLLPLAKDDPNAKRVVEGFQSVQAEYLWHAEDSIAAIEAYVRLILVAARRVASMHSNGFDGVSARADLFARFRMALELHFRNWQASDYVEEFSTTKYLLHQAVKAATGEGVSEAVQARRLIEAKRLLLYSDLAAAAIAYESGFESPAYFSRFFKAKVGQSPSEWRKARRAANET